MTLTAEEKAILTHRCSGRNHPRCEKETCYHYPRHSPHGQGCRCGSCGQLACEKTDFCSPVGKRVQCVPVGREEA